MNRIVKLTQALVHRIAVRFILSNLMVKAQAVVVGHHKRLNDVGQDACRHQLTLKAHFLHGKVVEAVDHKGIEAVVELAFQIVSVLH